MERNYEQISKVVEFIIEQFNNDVKETEDAACKVLADWRFSAADRENAVQDLYKDLQEKADEYTKKIKEAAKDFCDTYRVKLPSDNKEHSMDIANALKVIDMLGFNLTAETLKTILEPIKNSYKHMKIIHDVITTKNVSASSLAGVQYEPAVISTIQEYLGLNTNVYDYLDAFNDIEEISKVDGYRLGFSKEKYSANVVSITPNIPYSMFVLPDAMIRAGEMYATLENEFSKLFKVHTPTDQEMIESVIK